MNRPEKECPALEPKKRDMRITLRLFKDSLVARRTRLYRRPMRMAILWCRCQMDHHGPLPTALLDKLSGNPYV